MKADKDKCIACKRCFPYCPMGRIQTFARHDKIPGRVYIEIEQDACTDCGMCLRAKICPVNALFQPEEPWPREVRGVLSNPMIEFMGSQTPGRGTEEMKTNDVKGTFLPGEVGVGIELGRPGVGAYFRDVETVAMALMKANLGYQLAAENPVTHFMSDKTTGKLRDDVVNEKATSAIIEGKCKLEKLPAGPQDPPGGGQDPRYGLHRGSDHEGPAEGRGPHRPRLQEAGDVAFHQQQEQHGVGRTALHVRR